MTNDWIFETQGVGYPRRTPLCLEWEVERSAMSDDYDPHEISAEELLARWLDKAAADYGDEVPINWYVDSHAGFEFAPFARPDHAHGNENFLDFYTWPTHAVTGQRLVWTRLPVADKRWTAKRADKGGFIQEATGFKPGPFQPSVRLDVLRNNPSVDRRRS